MRLLHLEKRDLENRGVDMVKNIIKISVLLIFFTVSIPLFSFAAFNASDYNKKPLGVSYTTREFEGNTWNSGSDINQLWGWVPYFRVNPDWDPTDPGSGPMMQYGPNHYAMNGVAFNGQTDITGWMMSSGLYSGGGYTIADSSFNGNSEDYTLISNTDMNGHDIVEGAYDISTSDFNGNTDISVTAREAGGVGTQISSSTFNDDTSISVADGGTLQIENSTINLANENIMDKYFGKGSPMMEVLYQCGVQLWSIQYFITQFQNIPVAGNEAPYVDMAWLWNICYPYPPSGSQAWIYYCTSIYRPIMIVQNEQVSLSFTAYYVTLRGFLESFYYDLFTYLNYIFNLFRSWFYPLIPSSENQYWRYWNTDTQQQEETNLAGVLYNITWYLGQMFLMNTWEAGNELESPISDLNDKFSDLDSAEDSIWGSVSDGFDSFAPDLSQISGLQAIGWVSTYLQNLFTSLGAFSIPITVSLVLAVCMQFIGYFKYKN